MPGLDMDPHGTHGISSVAIGKGVAIDSGAVAVALGVTIGSSSVALRLEDAVADPEGVDLEFAITPSARRWPCPWP